MSSSFHEGFDIIPSFSLFHIWKAILNFDVAKESYSPFFDSIKQRTDVIGTSSKIRLYLE